ncbi:Golgi transport complex subunit 6 [Chamberlinius hualienensis]
MADLTAVMKGVEEIKFSDKDRYSSTNPLAKKLSKLLEGRFENDKDTIEALKALSTYFTENNLRTRRNLRSDIERRSLVNNEEFLQSFKQVNDSLQCVYQNVKSMNETCQGMTDRLKAVKAQTNELISRTTKLQSENQVLQLRQEVVNAFINSYQLKPEELKALKGSRDGGLDASFFEALSRVKQIHGDCKVLLRQNQQTAGLESMESMALHLEAAFERLYRWTQSECRMLTSDCPDIPQLVCLAMKVLQERPMVFKYCIDEFGAARRAAVVRSFIDALTRGGPGGNPRPIELHSHDPLRYVGDMLAWIHQASASEKEHFEALLKSCSLDVIMQHTSPSLSHIMESVCRPLRVRVEQVILSEAWDCHVISAVKFTAVLHQHNLVLRIDECGLLITIEEMQTLANKMFLNSVQCYMTKLLDKVESAPFDLSPTDSCVETLGLLRDVLTCLDTSVVSPEDKKREVAQILSAVVDPLLQLCALSASKLSPIDMAIFLINCGYSIQMTLTLFQYTDQRLEMLQALVDAHLDTLVSEQVSGILSFTGFGTIYATVQQHNLKEGPLSHNASADPLVIKSSMSKFDSFLASPDSLTIPQLEFLQSATVRQQLKQRSMDLVYSTYQLIYNAVYDPNNEYTDPFSLMPRSSEQVRQLL